MTTSPKYQSQASSSSTGRTLGLSGYLMALWPDSVDFYAELLKMMLLSLKGIMVIALTVEADIPHR